MVQGVGAVVGRGRGKGRGGGGGEEEEEVFNYHHVSHSRLLKKLSIIFWEGI